MKKIIIIVLITLIISVGIFLTRKRKVNEKSFKNVKNIIVKLSQADINLYTTGKNEIEVFQYSRSGNSKKFIGTIEDDELTISNDDLDVSSSYDIYIPVSYEEKINIDIKKGNINYDGKENQIFDSINLNIEETGNIRLNELKIKSNSNFYINNGNIDISLLVDSIVEAKTENGDINIDSKYDHGDIIISAETKKGNINIK